jgi:hypothetical protein
MNSKTLVLLFLLFFILQHAVFSQNFQGIYQTTDPENPLVLSISEQGELLMGKLFQSDLSSKEFVGRKGKSGFAGVFEVEGKSEEVHGDLDNKSLILNLKAENRIVKMERVSKDLNYDFSKVFGEATKELKDKITGVWILKEHYKIENGEKDISEMTGKEYMTAFNPDGKYVMDIKFIRDMEQKKDRELNTPTEFRLKATDYFEMSQMMSWKIVGNNIHIFPSQSVPGVPNLVQISSVEFENEKMILKSIEHGWIGVYERKK